MLFKLELLIKVNCGSVNVLSKVLILIFFHSYHVNYNLLLYLLCSVSNKSQSEESMRMKKYDRVWECGCHCLEVCKLYYRYFTLVILLSWAVVMYVFSPMLSWCNIKIKNVINIMWYLLVLTLSSVCQIRLDQQLCSFCPVDLFVPMFCETASWSI